MNTRKCLYCTQEKQDDQFSLEHIFPDALGGSLFSKTFKTKNVCKRCNSISGLFIDGPFIRNFFTQNDQSQAYLNYVNFNKPTAMPLKYFGVLEDSVNVDQEKVCEVWGGPHGGIVYHVRQKADEKYDTMIGGNPIDSKKDNGWIVIFAQNNDRYWNEVLLLSCAKFFKKAKRFSGNIPYLNDINYFNEPTDENQKSIDFLKCVFSTANPCQFLIETGFEQRFLAKLALGLGYNLFGEPFLNSDDSQRLRNAMWEKDLNKRTQIIDFSDYFDQEIKNFSYIAWEGVHTLILFPIKNITYLGFFCFGYKLMKLSLCTNRTIWKDHINSDGLVYIAAPQLETFVDSLTITDYLAHRMGIKKIQELDEIEKHKIDVSKLPKITE